MDREKYIEWLERKLDECYKERLETKDELVN